MRTCLECALVDTWRRSGEQTGVLSRRFLVGGNKGMLEVLRSFMSAHLEVTTGKRRKP